MSTSSQSTLWTRFNSALGNTRQNLESTLSAILGSEKEIDTETLDQLETSLLVCDVGVTTTSEIISKLKRQVARKRLKDPTAACAILRDELTTIAKRLERSFEIKPAKPFIVLFVGVNGVGKTTTIGKLASRFQAEGHSLLLAAGDTYRAAAIEQLQYWGEINDVPVVSQQQGADSAAVIHDAIQIARSKSIDVVLADTAGRLHSNVGLMDELVKVKRVIRGLDSNAPHETILVLEASIGQNALSQVRAFHTSLDISGLILTKLDGTAKGGVILALSRIAQLPLYFVGLGESTDALQPFDAESYVDGLLTS